MPQNHNKNRKVPSRQYHAEEERFDLVTFQSSIDLLQQRYCLADSVFPQKIFKG